MDGKINKGKSVEEIIPTFSELAKKVGEIYSLEKVEKRDIFYLSHLSKELSISQHKLRRILRRDRIEKRGKRYKWGEKEFIKLLTQIKNQRGD